ncbi:tRNA pseudouridine(38-40) synthase TruA [Neorhodopirellula lusitana]|uniref:tRNA pseudouridine(38-40) synthase TruA n=1 Tax=Neorhodopirellula lusitana TaxID=445327 RepID=UPI00384D9C82
MTTSITEQSVASRTRTFALTVSYDGTQYSGWQVQPGRKTIQGELERVVRPLMGQLDEGDQCDSDSANDTSERDRSVRILGSGRTDAGVHAIGQVARCVMPRWSADGKALLRAINSRLPDDIVVLEVREAKGRFHPIADALGKCYRYQIQVGGNRDPFRYRTWHRVTTHLDLDLLQKSAKKFIGCHDFAAFQAAGSQRNSTVRTITSSQWRPAIEPVDGSCSAGTQWVYQVEGNGFLYNMVRNLVGTMIEVARGRRSLDWIDEVIASKDRNQAGPTAPPHGLFLCRVDYRDDLFQS